MMRTLAPAVLVATAAVLGVGCAFDGGGGRRDAGALARPQIEALVASPDRSDADRRNDLRRKPVEMLSFVGVRPGMVVLDVSAGGGYTAELLARAVAPNGRVYGQTSRAPSATLAERLRKPAGANIVSVVQPFETPVPADVGNGRFDLVTLMFNYHDLGGIDRSRLNAAVFAALKPGDAYVVADHSGRAGTGISESTTLHRVEEALVRREVEAAGFRLAASGDFLRNPGDPRDRETPDPPQSKDEFVLKFVKP
ncbi:MAG: methyltransferase domain-containing protein [Caldimonas sp.]